MRNRYARMDLTVPQLEIGMALDQLLYTAKLCVEIFESDEIIPDSVFRALRAPLNLKRTARYTNVEKHAFSLAFIKAASACPPALQTDISASSSKS